MSERVLALLKKDGKYIAGVFTSQGLYTSSLPCDIKSDAVKDVNGGSLRREDTDERMMALETVYAVHEGSKDAAVHDINLDFAGFTPKQVAVLKVVMKIPFGSTMSYGDVACWECDANQSTWTCNSMSSRCIINWSWWLYRWYR